MNGWKFSDPPNVATFTVRQVIEGLEPILLVAHDADDGGWQFLSGSAIHMADALLVSLSSVVECDPSVTELADLPLGWQATRSAADQPWQRSLTSQA